MPTSCICFDRLITVSIYSNHKKNHVSIMICNISPLEAVYNTFLSASMTLPRIVTPDREAERRAKINGRHLSNNPPAFTSLPGTEWLAGNPFKLPLIL